MGEHEQEFEFERAVAPKDFFPPIRTRVLAGDFQGALALLEEVMKEHFAQVDLYEDDMRATMFWNNRTPRIEKAKADAQEYALVLIACYDEFAAFLEKRDATRVRLIDAFRAYAFGQAARHLESAFVESGNEALLKPLGRALTEVGEYANAVRTLEYALTKNRYDAYTLAMLAETHYRLGDERKAKAFLREALFYDPEAIPYACVRNPIMEAVDRVTRERGFEEFEERRLWYGVYGELEGILNVKKRMSAEEVISLRKTLARFEAAYKNEGKRRRVLPRLTLAYLWLIVQAELQGDEHNEAPALRNKLAKANLRIYNDYFSNEDR